MSRNEDCEKISLPRTERRRLKRRREIIEAAISLLEKANLSSLSIQAVAELADLSKSTLYKYFDSRRALIDAVISRLLAPQFAQIEDVIGAAISVDVAVHGTLQALLESLLSLVTLCGSECLQNASVLLHVQSTIHSLETRLRDLDLIVPQDLPTMACSWAYGLAVTKSLYTYNKAPRSTHSLASEAATLLLSGCPVR